MTEKIRYAWRVACTLSGERNESGIFFKKIPNKRADDFYVAVQWLEDCGLIHICPRCLEPSGNLAGNIDLQRSNSFKVFPFDIGLRMEKCGYEPDFSIKDTVSNSLWGKIIEQFVH